ncbi:transcriptional regulator with GAF, ATPase, and Fis domain [Saccharopolyspora lacisalsi]|uniref:Transcriptional regulator with GAF, ATPase, and Fis domain n=1 Tax=Halosaccharopolyspora lacisalsi TaxID=1000566 RepID=A0A839E3C0_9PSEU|nr:GAF and ANTAR domain-containing protein [Halosaccharopolyspora lacisalsi]MBA8827076.1 transcriptional regulator with GAF, ATPase, and Fis domain [Halosaccharopolyspora lacisalsi]
MSQGPAGGDTGNLGQMLSVAAERMSGSRSGSEDDTLALVVAGAVDTVPGAEHAGVSLLRSDGDIVSYTPSSETVSEVDQLQSTYREGPCVTALWDEHTVVVDDLTAEAWRWPRFAPEAAAHGMVSMLSFQLFTRGDTLGALNLYSSKPASFALEARSLGGLFASHAAIALGGAQHVAQLHQALASRDLIGQAKGMLMERFGLDDTGAFAMLVDSSQQTNMKLVDVARWLTGQTATQVGNGKGD